MVGKKAPEFSLEGVQNGEIRRFSSQDFMGKWLLLLFYPRDFTFVCPTELKSLAHLEPEFLAEGCAVAAASTDSEFSHKAWLEKTLPSVKYPVLADTSHTLSRSYGVLLEGQGTALRGAFLIDPQGIVQYATVSNLNVGRSLEEFLRVLQALKTGGMCPAGWKKGDKPL